jgi:hypothetical protein
VVNRKVVDLITLFNFYKGRTVFLRILHKLQPNFECRHVSVNRSCCRLTTFFANFHSKFEVPIYMKVVSLGKLDNFHIGRF